MFLVSLFWVVVLNKKADAVAAIFIVLIIVVFLGWLINIGNRECNSNKDCKEGYYCTVEHSCNKIPVLEKEIVIQHNYIWPSIILGLAIIIAAIILRYKWNGKKETSNENKPADAPPQEPYYKNF